MRLQDAALSRPLGVLMRRNRRLGRTTELFLEHLGVAAADPEPVEAAS